jgi:ABC-2 type transport system permease protein
MTNVIAIYRRELRAYFDGPLAYIIVPIFLGLVGVFCLYFQDVFAAGLVNMKTVFFWMAIFYLLLVPALTMKAFSEEMRTGSLEMLVTLPISEEEMVLGKYLASLSLVFVTLILSFSYPVSLHYLGDLDWGPVIGGYLGLGLLGAAFCAIGVAMSSITNSQVVAFLLSFTVGVLPFATGYALNTIPSSWLPVVQYMTFEYHFSNLAKGVIDSRNIIFYLSVIALFLHFSVQRLEARRLS